VITKAAAPIAERELAITRTFDAPRELVFRMWTDPAHVARWWGPHHFTNPVCEVDARVGGAILIHMRAPDGVDHPMTGRFLEIAPPERLVFTTAVDSADGERLLEGHTTVTFAEHGGKTTLTLNTRAVGFAAVAARMLEGMQAGWTQSLEKLEALVNQTRA
jgi:uncharacterized protein YndB with AHSA1/START domain